jgi:hypothetical protein
VHTTLDDATHWGSPLQDGNDLYEHRKHLHCENSKRVLILMNSHVGGHKFAGNMMVCVVLVESFVFPMVRRYTRLLVQEYGKQPA